MIWELILGDLVNSSGRSCKGGNRTDTGTPFQWAVPVGSRQEDTVASGCQQNTISRLGGLDLLHQKVLDLAPPYLQCYS